jgi:hypothetical protein
MGWFIYTTVIFLGLAGLVASVIVGVRYSRLSKPIEVEHNLPMVENLNPQFTEGHVQGLELRNAPKKNGNIIVYFLPTDIRYKENMDFQKEIKIYKFVVGRGMRVNIGTGEFSSYREIVKYNSNNPQDISQKITSFPLGDALAKQSIITHINNKLRMSDEQAEMALTDIVKRNARGQLTRKDIDQWKMLLAELVKAGALSHSPKEEKND